MKLNLDVAARIVSADRIAQGAWMQLTLPGQPDALVFADKAGKHPARLKVRSHRHKEFQDAIYQGVAAAAATRKNRSKPAAEAVREDFAANRARHFSLLVLAIENMDSKQLGKEITPEPEDLEAVARAPENQWIVDQVMNFAFTDSNFGADDEAPAGNGDAGSRSS